MFLSSESTSDRPSMTHYSNWNVPTNSIVGLGLSGISTFVNQEDCGKVRELVANGWNVIGEKK